MLEVSEGRILIEELEDGEEEQERGRGRVMGGGKRENKAEICVSKG